MTIKSVEFFSRTQRCAGIFAVNRFPYSDSNVQHDGGPLGARWEHEGKSYSWQAIDKIAMYPSPDLNFFVVVYARNAPGEFAPPHNAFVLNADGTVRHHIRQPVRYAGQNTEFLDAWWYERNPPCPRSPWWAFWRKPQLPSKDTRMKLLIGWMGDPCQSFEAVDFNPETGEFGEVVDFGRL